MDHSARSVQIQRRSEFWRPKKTATRPAAVIVPTRPPTRTPRPTATPGKYVFLGNIPKNPNPAPDPLPVDPNLLTGMAAVTAAASATATALFMRRKREEELRRIADESRAEAEARARAANRQRIITNLQIQERMANPEKYRNVSTDQIPYDENKVAFNEGFIRAVKAGLIKPGKVSKAVAETKKKLLERQISSIILNSLREGRSPSKYWVVHNGRAYPKLAAFQDDGNSKAINVPEQISQYVSEIYELYGFNGCGPVSVCEAISHLTDGDKPFLECVSEFKNFVPKDFSIALEGIQPSMLMTVTEKYISDAKLNINIYYKIEYSLNKALKEITEITTNPNKVALLDLCLCENGQSLTECDYNYTFAHFAFLREVGNDYIIVSETLNSMIDGRYVIGDNINFEAYLKLNDPASHIKLDFNTLLNSWFNPELSATTPVSGAERLNYWFMILEKK